MANANKTGNPVVTSLPDYVDQERLPLIAKAVLGGKSTGLFSLQTDVKGPTKINLINTEITFQDAHNCGFNASGSTTLSQRQITPAYLKVNMQWCDKEILGTWAQYQVKVAAGQKTLPFEEEFVNGVVENVKSKLETMIYQGNSAGSGAQFDGLIKILKAANVTNTGIESTKYATLKKVYLALPETAIADDTAILVSTDFFRGFIQELVAANLYHYDANDGAGEYTLPGTNVKVMAITGLNGSGTVIAGRLSNIFYGTDMANDEEKFDLWYSKDDGVFKLAIEFTAGVQVAYPDQMVMAYAVAGE